MLSSFNLIKYSNNIKETKIGNVKEETSLSPAKSGNLSVYYRDEERNVMNVGLSHRRN